MIRSGLIGSRSSFLFEHDVLPKTDPTPIKVRGRLFRDHAPGWAKPRLSRNLKPPWPGFVPARAVGRKPDCTASLWPTLAYWRAHSLHRRLSVLRRATAQK